MHRSKLMGLIVLLVSVLGHWAAAQELRPRASATGVEEVEAPTVRQVVTGRVCRPDGSPAVGAVVVSSAGGQTVTGADGGFALAVDLPLEAESVEVTAIMDEASGSESLVACARFTPAALSGSVAAGRLTLALSPSCQPRWLSNIGGRSGTNDRVDALAVFDDGTGAALYAGGRFSIAGGVVAQRIAKWNGSAWSSLGSGMDAQVLALAVFDDGSGPALFAGGFFTSAGGVQANRIAKWDGASWSALRSGLNNRVTALTVFDDGSGPALYAGGRFTSAGGAAANYIAKWDGASWSALDSGVGPLGSSTVVHALTVFDDGSGPALYAAGEFTLAGGVSANRIAKWDGSAWSALGSGISHRVFALTVYDDGSGPALFAGGDEFTTAGGVTVHGIAKWDGSSWSALGSGVSGIVQSLTVHDDGGGPELYVGGSFLHAGGAGNSIAKWNGSTWSRLGSGVEFDYNSETGVHALAVYDDGGGPALVAGGGFDTASGVLTNHLAKWNGTSWSRMGSGIDATVQALAVFDDGDGRATYAGGEFSWADGTVVHKILKWDGSSVSALPGLSTDGIVHALEVFDDGTGPRLYAGFSDDSPAGFIKRWNGTSWSLVGGGLGNDVVALEVHDDGSGPALYAGGFFPGGRIARWDGTSWSALGSGMNAYVGALQVYDDGSGPALYAGGNFTTAGGLAASHVAKWDGSSWSPLGSGVNGVVQALTAFDDGGGPALFACGSFTTAGGLPARRIARWNGSSWSALGSGLNGAAYSLVALDDGTGPALFVGGSFTVAGGTAASRIARWYGTSWSALGAGVTDTVRFLAVLPGELGTALMVGGSFQASPAGDSYLTKWGCRPKSTKDTVERRKL